MLLSVYLDHRKAKYLAYVRVISAVLYVEEISVELLVNGIVFLVL